MPSQNQDLEELSSRELSQIATRGNAALEERLSRLRDAVRDLERRMIDCENIMAEQFKCTESTVSTIPAYVPRRTSFQLKEKE